MAPIAMSNDCSSRRCIDLSSLPGTSSVRLSSRNDNLNGSESLLPVRCQKHLVARHHEFRQVHALALWMPHSCQIGSGPSQRSSSKDVSLSQVNAILLVLGADVFKKIGVG